jgi:hypothetical protein
LIIIIVIGEEYKLWSPSLCSFLPLQIWRALENILDEQQSAFNDDV